MTLLETRHTELAQAQHEAQQLQTAIQDLQRRLSDKMVDVLHLEGRVAELEEQEAAQLEAAKE